MSLDPSSTEEIISAALVEYTKLTKKDLVKDPLAIKIKIQRCDSTNAIYQILEQHAPAFRDDSESSRRLKECQNVIIDNLRNLASMPPLSEVATIRKDRNVLPPVQLVFSALIILLSSSNAEAKRDPPIRSAIREALVDLFHYIEIVLKRLKIEPDVTVTQTITHKLVEIMMQFVSVFAIATMEVNEGLLKKYAKKLLEGNDVGRILQRLDRLTSDEARKTVTPTLEIIYVLVNNLSLVMQGENPSTEGIGRALRDIQQVVTEMAELDRHALQQECRRWLSPPDPSINHNIARKAHHDGTATWFIEGPTFKDWKTTGGLLWIHGNPGSGKSVLSSTIVDHLRLMRTTGLATVGYFYVDFRERAKQEVRGLLSSLLTQLSTQSDRFCHILASLHASHERGQEEPSEDVLAQCLREMLEDPNQAPVFIVVDALDECPNSEGLPTPREQALEIVKELVELKLQHLHLCITSRPEIDIRGVLEPLKPYGVSLHDEAGQIDDIARYVESVVSSDATMREWPKEERNLVINTLAKDGGGMFRWAFCQLETLRRTPLQKIPFALKALPKGLDETYERTLQCLDEEKWEYAHRIFQFLTVSARPLYVQEVAEVFSIQINEEATGIPEFNARWREKDPELAVLSACSSLVAVVKVYGEQVVQFSHFSVQEFLTSNRLRDKGSTSISQYHVLSRPAHTFFARACLSVLLQLNLRIHKNSIKAMFPLATYAAEHWVGHAQCGHVSSLVEDGMDRLFEDNSRFAAWIWVYNIDNPSGPHMDSNKPGIPETSPLYYAALCGFIDMVKRLIDSHLEGVHTRGRDGATPLHAALRNGHSDVAQLLLQPEHKADANARDNQNETPLHIASRRGDITAIQCLITSGAKMNAKNRDNETPLSFASSKGSLEAARLLLKHGADVDHKVTHGRTALHVAAEHGHYSVANLLLSNGADVDAKDRNDRTPLHVAADHGKVGVARLLLQRCADKDAREVSQQTPLHMASSGGQLEAVRALLDFKADVNAEDEEGWTALHLAAYNGHLKVAELLLTRGATWNIKNNDGSTPFEVASENHHTEVARMLPQGPTAGSQRSQTWN